MDIGIVAKKSGLKPSTLRFYEEKGLIESIGRHGLRRIFDEDILERLSLIALGRQSGFTLDEIANIFTDNGPDIDRSALLIKADELDATIKQLSAIRDGLRHAANCDAPSHSQCPKFRKYMSLALRKQRHES